MRLNLLYNMVKGMVKFLPFYLFTFLPLNAGAQTFTERIQQQVAGEGTVTIQHDAVIDELVNGNSTPVSSQTTTPAKPPKQTTPTKPNKQTATNHQLSNTQQPTPNTNHQTPNTQEQTASNQEQSADTPVKRYRTSGYRVQVFRGGNSKADRQKAESAGNRIREAYPGHAVYVEFFSPEWTCRVGNFRDIEDARKMRDEIRKMGYETATIVRGKIIVSVPQ